MVPPSDADRAQADAFCDDLQTRIARLDEKASKFRGELSKYLAAGRKPQVVRVQRSLRAVAIERRKLIDMLIATGHSYPCNHAAGTIGER